MEAKSSERYLTWEGKAVLQGAIHGIHLETESLQSADPKKGVRHFHNFDRHYAFPIKQS